MCVERDGTISQYTFSRTVRVIAELCKMFKLTANDIVRHYDITHKPCPKTFIDQPEQFNEFKTQVNAILNPPKTPTDSIPYPGILKIGSRGESVKKVQQKLKITVDGIFGPVTENAVKKFQGSNGLVVDGIVGKNTWGKLF
jgi:N-acetylmuramoyl-L-alanine amidase